MWPLWWWPHELMQPLMCRSMSPMSCSSSRSSKRSVMARGDRDRARVGERAQVAAGAGDHVGEQADVGRGEAGVARGVPERRAGRPRAPTAAPGSGRARRAARRALKRSARSAAASICVGGDVAGRLARALERQRHGAIAGEPVRVHVAVEPAREAARARRRRGADRRRSMAGRTFGRRAEARRRRGRTRPAVMRCADAVDVVARGSCGTRRSTCVEELLRLRP